MVDWNGNSPWGGMEAFTPASNIRPVRDIVQDSWEGVQYRVHKPNWALANGEALFIQLYHFVLAKFLLDESVCPSMRIAPRLIARLRGTYQSQD